MPALTVLGVPTNLSLPEGSTLTMVEQDVHDICGRLRELDENLHVICMRHVDGRSVFAITERDRDGKESLVLRVGAGCKIDALDARVIEHINWIRRIPVAERAAQIEKELERERLAREEEELDNLVERIGGSFYKNLHDCGFIDTPRPESMRKLNATARRAGRR